MKLTDHLKENLACQVLDPSYAIDKMCNVMCTFLVADQVRSCDPNIAVENQLDVMDGVSLIEGLPVVFIKIMKHHCSE